MAYALAAGLVAYNTAVALARVGSNLLVPLNVAITAALVAFADASEVPLGLSGEALGRGLLWGAALAPVAPLVLGLALLVPRGVRLLRDVRLAELSRRELWFRLLIRIPLATAAFEEIAFRGVLLGMLMETMSTAWAVAVSSAAFGVWHVGPAWIRSVANRPSLPQAGRLPEIAGTVLATALGGALFALLRLATGSVLAPVLVHASVNVAATLAGRAAARP